MTGPAVSPDPAQWRKVWEKALRARAKGYSPAEIDAATQEALGVDFPTLTRQLMSIENVADPQVRASPLAPFDPSQGEQAKVPPWAVAAFTPGAKLASLAGVDRLFPVLREYHTMAQRSAPLNAAMGDVTGGAVAGMAAGQIPVPISEGVLAPFAGAIRGSVQAAPLGLLSGLANQPDLAHPDLGQLAKETVLTAGAGGALGLFGDIGSQLYNPAVQKLKMGMETSSKGRFNLPEGMAALERPATADPVLQPLMAERGNLGTLATKYLRQSQVAADRAASLIHERLDAVDAAKTAIAEHPTTGYDAILRDQTIANPQAKALLLAAGRRGADAEPTARNVFSLYKRVRDHVQQAEAVQARAVSQVNTELLHENRGTMSQLRGMLGEEVPGFNDLQTRMQPYLDRENALRTLGVRLRGRGVYLKGKMPPPPPKGVGEKVREALQVTGYFGGERAARAMVNPLYGTASPADMLAQIQALEAAQGSRMLAPFGSGATAGLLGLPHVRDRLGLLQP